MINWSKDVELFCTGDDCEDLVYDEAEAVAAELKRLWWPGDSYCAIAQVEFPDGLEVTGYRRMTVPVTQIQHIAEGLVEDLDEQLSEDYGSNDPCEPSLLDGAHGTLARAIAADITRVLRDLTIQACEPVESRRWTADEVLALAREMDGEIL